MRKSVLVSIIAFVFVFVMAGCGTSSNGVPDPDKIVPKREVFIENLEDSGYEITTLTTIDGADLTIDRVKAQKRDKFFDIVYGLSDEDASEVFKLYCEQYPDDYYILAQNGNYVYCVSDKQTFAKAGFTTTDNIGEQYISN